MASIKIVDLRPAGSELFQDEESFLNELGKHELDSMIGGVIGISCRNWVCSVSDVVSISIGL